MQLRIVKQTKPKYKICDSVLKCLVESDSHENYVGSARVDVVKDFYNSKIVDVA